MHTHTKREQGKTSSRRNRFPAEQGVRQGTQSQDPGSCPEPRHPLNQLKGAQRKY